MSVLELEFLDGAERTASIVRAQERDALVGLGSRLTIARAAVADA